VASVWGQRNWLGGHTYFMIEIRGGGSDLVPRPIYFLGVVNRRITIWGCSPNRSEYQVLTVQ